MSSLSTRYRIQQIVCHDQFLFIGVTQVQTLFKSFAKDLEEAFRNAPCVRFRVLVSGSGLNTAMIASIGPWLKLALDSYDSGTAGWVWLIQFDVQTTGKFWLDSEPWEFHTEQPQIHSPWLRLCHHHLSERWRMSQLVLGAQRHPSRCVSKTGTLK